jgi:hypothetical protein
LQASCAGAVFGLFYSSFALSGHKVPDSAPFKLVVHRSGALLSLR